LEGNSKLSKKIGTGWNEVVGLLEVNRRIEVAVSSFPHYSNDKKLRRKKKKKWEERRRRRGREGKKETNASAVAAAVRHRLDRLSPLTARGTAPTGWRQIKRKKKKKVKTVIRRLLGEKEKKGQEELLGRERGSSNRRTGGCCWGVRSFGSTPSNIIYAPIIFPHVHTHTQGSIRRGHTITALLFSSLLSSQCARTEIK
jgi:hypothetical protein